MRLKKIRTSEEDMLRNFGAWEYHTTKKRNIHEGNILVFIYKKPNGEKRITRELLVKNVITTGNEYCYQLQVLGD